MVQTASPMSEFPFLTVVFPGWGIHLCYVVYTLFFHVVFFVFVYRSC